MMAPPLLVRAWVGQRLGILYDNRWWWDSKFSSFTMLNFVTKLVWNFKLLERAYFNLLNYVFDGVKVCFFLIYFWNQNRNAACGKHKEEILCQLRELSKLEPNSSDDQDETVPTIGFQSVESAQNCPLRFKGSGFMQNSDQHVVPSSEVNLLSLLMLFHSLLLLI